MKKTKKAFTLVELLVVIAIIGILATLAVVALQQARSSARDIRRVSDMKQISTALDLFMYENGRYPTEEEFYSVSGMLISPSSGEVFMYQIPEAPTPADGNCSNSDNSYVYNPSNDGSSYTIGYCLGKVVSDISFGGNCASPAGLSGSEDCVFSSGPETVNYDDPNPLCDPNEAVAYETDSEGYKLVHTCCELQHIGDTDYTSGDKFRLANNIDCSNTVNWTWSGTYTQYFRPIMTNYNTLVSLGNTEIDGNNFSITGLRIGVTGPPASLIGFNPTGDLSIRNLNIENAYISGSSVVGVIIGDVSGQSNISIDNVHIVDSLLTASNGLIGGLIGRVSNNALSLSNSSFSGSISTSGSHAGSIIGEVSGQSSISIDNFHTTDGLLTSNGYVGGLIGWVGDNTLPLSLSNSSFSGSISASNIFSGGLFGIIGHVPLNVYRSYVYNSNVSGVDNVGGFMGEYNIGNFSSSIVESYIINSEINGNSSVGGLIGVIYSSSGDTDLQISNSIVKDVSVLSTGNGTGGIVGSSAGKGYIVSNTYFKGLIDFGSNPSSFGALGYYSLGGSASNSYFIVTLAQANTGNNCLVRHDNTLFVGNNIYYNDGWCNYSGETYGTEKTEIELKTASTYSSWSPVSCVNANEDNPWVIKDGSYPCLYFEESCTCN